MKKRANTNIFNATNSLKVLSCLAENPGKQLLGSEIQKAASISRAGVYISLHELIKQRLVTRTKRGRFLLYSVVYNDPIIRQFKVLKNILLLRPLISKLKPSSKKIILYGKASRGEDSPRRDIDLFVLSREPEQTKQATLGIKIMPKIQMVIKTPAEFMELQEQDKEFYYEVHSGITLWEETE